MDAPRSKERVVSTDPVIGWRAWRMSIRRETVWLRPLGRRRGVWNPMVPTVAVCGHRRFHSVPSQECTCGLHVVKDVEQLKRTPSPAVIGTVALWGRVIEHDLGYRGRFGYPQRVAVICPECFWWPPSPGSSAEVVAVLSKGTALPLCGDHLEIARETGVRIRSLRRAADGESMLLRTYAVDLAPPIEPRSDRPIDGSFGARRPTSTMRPEASDSLNRSNG